MKDSFLLPLRLGIRFVLLTAAIFLLIFLYYFVIEYSPSMPPDTQWIASRALVAFSLSILPASILTIIFGYFLLLKYPGRLMPTFLSFFICIAAMFFFARFTSESFDNTHSIAPQASVYENTFLNYSDSVIYITHKIDQNVTDTVLLNIKDTAPHFHVYPSGFVVSETGMLKLNDRTVILEPANPAISSLISMPLFVSNVIRDLAIFKLILLRSVKNVLLFSLFFCTLWIFSRISAWPLFNLLLLLTAIRIILFSMYIAKSPFAERVMTAWNMSSNTVIEVCYFSIAILLIIWDLLFVPYPVQNNKRGMET